MTHKAATAAPKDVRQTLPVLLGVIDYLNCVPVYDWLLDQMASANLSSIETVAGTPAQMNQALLSGAIDISNVSSVAFGEHAREWLLIPHLSVAAHGAVESVLLFSWHDDWRMLDGRSIALTDHSATSVALVKLLSERRYGIRPRYVTQPPDLDAMLAEHDAALLIGDIALREGYLRRAIADRGQPLVFDLATEWQTWTGLPFCFSVWAARAERTGAIAASEVVRLLHDSRERGIADLDRLAREAAARLDLPIAVCERYLWLLDYDLVPSDLAGLRRFLEMAVPDFRWSSVRFIGESA
ncbi:MAG TPA: menaquinone biosynthesis protein [Ktedonobacterales bacterium]|jgi:chorismate dehydratase